MKYIVARKSNHTGKVEYKRTKFADSWCGAGYTGPIWKFSKQGAAGIIERESRFYGWHYDYYMVPSAE